MLSMSDSKSACRTKWPEAVDVQMACMQAPRLTATLLADVHLDSAVAPDESMQRLLETQKACMLCRVPLR